MSLVRDSSVTWEESDSGGSSSAAGIIGAAIGIPAGIVGVLAVAAYYWFYWRKRQQNSSARSVGSGSGEGLAQPLVGATLSEGDLQRPSVAASDVHLQVPRS